MKPASPEPCDPEQQEGTLRQWHQTHGRYRVTLPDCSQSPAKGLWQPCLLCLAAPTTPSQSRHRRINSGCVSTALFRALALCVSPQCRAGEHRWIAQVQMCKTEMESSPCVSLHHSHLCILASLLTLVNKMPFLSRLQSHCFSLIQITLKSHFFYDAYKKSAKWSCCSISLTHLK